MLRPNNKRPIGDHATVHQYENSQFPFDRTTALENKLWDDDFDDHDPVDDELIPASKFKPANWEKVKRDPNPRPVREKSLHRYDDVNNWSKWGNNKKKTKKRPGSNRNLGREKTKGRSKLPYNSPVNPIGTPDAPNKKWWEEDFEEPDLDEEPVAAKNKWGNENFGKDDYLMTDVEDDLLLPDEDDFFMPDEDDYLFPDDEDNFLLPDDEDNFLLPDDEDNFLMPNNDFFSGPTDKTATYKRSGEEENYFAHDLLKADKPEHGTYDPNWDRPRFTDEESGNGYADGMKWTDFDKGKQDKLDEEYKPNFDADNGKWNLDRDEDRFNGGNNRREKRRSNGFGRRLYNVKV